MKKQSKTINLDEINRFLYYDENSPSCLKWKESRRGGRKVGDMAGSLHKNKKWNHSCWRVTVGGTAYYAHRLVYMIINGVIDDDLEVDHIDGNALNNKIDNLRLVNHSINSRNMKQFANNKTGVTGVSYDEIQNRYVAYYHDSSGKIHRKTFPCLKLGEIAAFNLACQWRKEYHKELNEMLGDEGYSFRHGTKV